MRFAGQRFRAEDGSIGRVPKESGKYGRQGMPRYSAPGVPASRNRMPDIDVRSMSKTAEPEFRIGDFSHPEFRI